MGPLSVLSVCNVGVLWPDDWMDRDTTWYAGRPRPSHNVLDRDQLPQGKGHSSPHFSAHVFCGQTAGWIRMPLGTEVGLGPRDIVLDGDPAPPRKGTQWIPTFQPISIVAKRSPMSETAELLFPMVDVAHNPHCGVLVWHNFYQLYRYGNNRVTLSS